MDDDPSDMDDVPFDGDNVPFDMDDNHSGGVDVHIFMDDVPSDMDDDPFDMDDVHLDGDAVHLRPVEDRQSCLSGQTGLSVLHSTRSAARAAGAFSRSPPPRA